MDFLSKTPAVTGMSGNGLLFNCKLVGFRINKMAKIRFYNLLRRRKRRRAVFL
jgi:hypothetical protein